MGWENTWYKKLKWRLNALGSPLLPVGAICELILWPQIEHSGELINHHLLGGLSWLILWNTESQTCDYSQKRLVIRFWTKVYLWPLMRRCLAGLVQPTLLVSYSGNLKMALCPALPLRQRKPREKANGEPWHSAWVGSEHITWEPVRNADSYLNKIPW